MADGPAAPVDKEDRAELMRFWRTFPPPSNEVAAADIIEQLQGELAAAESQCADFRRQLTAEREGRMAAERVMDEAIFLGAIRMGAVNGNADRKQAFMNMMRDIVADIIEEKTGTRPTWGGPEHAPEHERAGRG